jgi:phenylacetate-coenzyme A ligase PaaK-like adenylate-forming protein
VSCTGSLRALTLEIEPIGETNSQADLAARVSHQLRLALGLTVPVKVVEAGTLPRFEMKARRFIVSE